MEKDENKKDLERQDIKRQGGTDAEHEEVRIARASPEKHMPPAENADRGRVDEETLGVP